MTITHTFIYPRLWHINSQLLPVLLSLFPFSIIMLLVFLYDLLELVLPFLIFLFLLPSLLFWFMFLFVRASVCVHCCSPLSTLDWQLTDAVVPLPSGRSTVGVSVI